jgi:hypothetical protein
MVCIAQDEMGNAMTLRALHIIGLALNVIGTGIIFMWAYPPDDEGRRRRYVRLSRFALLLVFCGFLLQLITTIYDGR